MDLPTLFEELNKYFSAFPNKDIITSEICSLEQFIEDNGYLFQQLKTQLPEIEQDYISNTNNTKCVTQIFKQIAQLLNIDSANNDNLSLINRKCNNKLSFFTSYIRVSIISEYLITCYRQFGLDINEYITNNELFKQLQSSTSVPCTAMKHYIGAYEKLVHKPLPCINNKMSIDKYNDNMNVITQYMIRINTKKNTHKQLNLEGVKCNNDARKNTAAICDVYRFNGQRFIMLTVPGNNDTINATIYVLKPNVHNFARNKRISDYVELMYLLNSKSMIVSGLSPCDSSILGLDCNKVYISYGNYKSCVFKNDILNKLKFVFNWHNDKIHIIAENTKTDCNKAYISYYDHKSCVFKNEIEKGECIKITGCELNSIQPTYADLKTEIIVLGISSTKYERTYYKAKTFRRSFATPKYKTPSDGTLNNQLFDIGISWKKGQLITVDELFVLMLVIDYDIVKSALSQCDGQRLNRIFNLRRQLFVILNKYGSSNFGPHNKLYVPATQQITTSGPLVTTSSLTVSEILTSEEGMTIAILPQSKCWKAFDASKLSDYHKQLWLIDFIYLPNIQIKKCQIKVSDNESVPICKI